MSAPLLRALHVAKSFGGVSALRDGRLELAAGSVHALCGANDTGKSTFLDILMGLLQRDAGSIAIKGREVEFGNPNDALKSRISTISQELSPIPGMSVGHPSMWPTWPRSTPPSRKRRPASGGSTSW